MFNGILGKEVGKREIVIIGEAVDRAILYMERAREVYGKIYVDYHTKLEAQMYLDFQYAEHKEFPNKIINMSIFEP